MFLPFFWCIYHYWYIHQKKGKQCRAYNIRATSSQSPKWTRVHSGLCALRPRWYTFQHFHASSYWEGSLILTLSRNTLESCLYMLRNVGGLVATSKFCVPIGQPHFDVHMGTQKPPPPIPISRFFLYFRSSQCSSTRPEEETIAYANRNLFKMFKKLFLSNMLSISLK